MKLIQKLGQQRSASTLSLDDLIKFFSFNGLDYPYLQQSSPGTKAEEIGGDFRGLVEGAYKQNGIVFSCMMVRQLLFQEVTFAFRRKKNGRPGEFFSTSALDLLEEPWPGGSTSDLLARMIQDTDLAGNWYGARGLNRIDRLRPDYVTIVMGSRLMPDTPGVAPDAEVAGYIYDPPDGEAIVYLPEQVAHYCPIPDPSANFRGMSWLTPVIREVMGDQAATTHKLKYFEQGAPQPLDAKVLTPSGWSTMGEMQVGTEVIGRDGQAHPVAAVYPQGEKPVYRIEFSDGATTECTEDHLWRVANTNDRVQGRYRTLPLKDILKDGLAYDSGPLKWSVPYVEPVQYAERNRQAIDPYLFGLLLGDGSFRGNGKGSGGVDLAMDSQDAAWTVQHVRELVPAGVSMTVDDCGGWHRAYFKGPGSPRPNPMTTAVRELGMWDVLSRDKWIPDEYRLASVEDRIALLQGIVDADGHIDAKQGNATLTTTSERLAADVAEIVGSLGGVATFTRNRGRSTIKVQIKRLPEWIVPCRLPRKVERYKRRRQMARFIRSVELVGVKPTQCIGVDSDEHLYVTDDFVVTHNTANMVVKFDPALDQGSVTKWIDLMEGQIGGAENAYRTLYLGGGADANVVGANLEQVDFKNVQGAGETRIAAAAGLPPVIAGFSEGLAAATYSNYGQARRRFADGTMRPLWNSAAGALKRIVRVPSGAKLAPDDRDVAFLQEDLKDAAEIQKVNAEAIKGLTEAGYDPASVVDAVTAGDLQRLEHSGLYSVQLQTPGADNGQPGDGPQRMISRSAPKPGGEAHLRAIAQRFRDVEGEVQELLTLAVDGQREARLGGALEALDSLRGERPEEAIATAYSDAIDTIPVEFKSAADSPVKDLAYGLREKLREAIDMAESNAPDAFRGVTDETLEEMLRAAVVAHVDDAEREWSLSSWAENQIQTLGRRATSTGIKDGVGDGYVQYSQHGSTHPACKPREGKVYKAIEAPTPPLHENCGHMLIPVPGPEGS